MSNFQRNEESTSASSSRGTGGESAEKEADRMESQANTNAVSRALAVMILMLLPGVAGSYLDSWLGTQFFVLIGFGLGIGIAIFGLLYVAKIADIAAKRSRELRNQNREKSEKSNSRDSLHEDD
jgi:hypothetical protein